MSCKNLLNPSLFPENGFGGFRFNLIGFGSFVTTDGCISASGWTMLTSSLVLVFLWSLVSSTIRSSGSESTDAVLKLSNVCVVSEVCCSGPVVGSLHNPFQLSGSKLDNTGVLPPGSSMVLLVRGPRSSSSGDSGDGLSIQRNLFFWEASCFWVISLCRRGEMFSS